LGAVEGGDGYGAGGTYATWHAPRSNEPDGWGHVLKVAEGAALLGKFRKPLVSDEPIGAAAAHIPGRRDSEPRRFAAAAAVTRLAGLGATFHYEGGLQAKIPSGSELACFTAWSAALAALAGLPDGGRFLTATEAGALVTPKGARAVFARDYRTQIWLVVVDPAEPAVELMAPWHEVGRLVLPGVIVIRGAARS
jgi:hypothetical protein